jgi:hypothetical protein
VYAGERDRGQAAEQPGGRHGAVDDLGLREFGEHLVLLGMLISSTHPTVAFGAVPRIGPRFYPRYHARRPDLIPRLRPRADVVVPARNLASVMS